MTFDAYLIDTATRTILKIVTSNAPSPCTVCGMVGEGENIVVVPHGPYKAGDVLPVQDITP